MRIIVTMIILASLSSAYAQDLALPAWAAVDKGDFQYSEPDPFPVLALDLDHIEQQVGTAASERCATPLAAAPLDLGDAESVMGKMLGKAANAAIGSFAAARRYEYVLVMLAFGTLGYFMRAAGDHAFASPVPQPNRGINLF